MMDTKKVKHVYKIVDRKTKEHESVYSMAYHQEEEFNSVSEARGSHCQDIYQDAEKYAIAKYRVTYELVDEDCKE